MCNPYFSRGSPKLSPTSAPVRPTTTTRAPTNVQRETIVAVFECLRSPSRTLKRRTLELTHSINFLPTEQQSHGITKNQLNQRRLSNGDQTDMIRRLQTNLRNDNAVTTTCDRKPAGARKARVAADTSTHNGMGKVFSFQVKQIFIIRREASGKCQWLQVWRLLCHQHTVPVISESLKHPVLSPTTKTWQ